MSNHEDDSSGGSLNCFQGVCRDENDELSSVESGANDEAVEKLVQITRNTTLSFPWSSSLKETVQRKIQSPSSDHKHETTPSAVLAESKAEKMWKEVDGLVNQHGSAEEQKVWNAANQEQQTEWIADMFLSQDAKRSES